MPPDEHAPSGLSPRQIVQLLEDVRETRDTVIKIKSLCEPCRKRVDRLATVIDGDSGNGLKGRVSQVERTQKAFEENNTRSEVRYAEMVEKQMKWSRTQIKAVIVALLSFVGMAAAYFFGG